MCWRSISDCIFFFSSRRRHTRYWRDWSSDVCSSDLVKLAEMVDAPIYIVHVSNREAADVIAKSRQDGFKSMGETCTQYLRSEERRVGKSVDLGGRRIIKKKKTELQE